MLYSLISVLLVSSYEESSFWRNKYTLCTLILFGITLVFYLYIILIYKYTSYVYLDFKYPTSIQNSIFKRIYDLIFHGFLCLTTYTSEICIDGVKIKKFNWDLKHVPYLSSVYKRTQ